MGVIQGTINQAIGTVAAVATANKMTDAKMAKEGEGLLKEQVSLAQQATDTDANIKAATENVAQLEHKSQDKRLGEKSRTNLAYDLDMAKRALGNLTDQQNAIAKLRELNTSKLDAIREKGGKI